MSLTHAEICARIPHGGSMCLLARVQSYDSHSLLAYAESHRLPDNPLRGAQGLAAVCAVEYAAQAMALHAHLLADAAAPPRIGVLASVRDFKLFVPRLDDIAGDLRILVQRLSGSEESVVYAFEVGATEAIASGRMAARLMGVLPKRLD